MSDVSLARQSECQVDCRRTLILKNTEIYSWKILVPYFEEGKKPEGHFSRLTVRGLFLRRLF